MERYHPYSKSRCIETIAPRDDWLIRVGHKLINLNYLRNEDIRNRRILDNTHVCSGETYYPAPQAIEKDLYGIIEEDPLRCYNYIEKESLRTQLLVPRMALFLSPRTINLICDKIFTKRNINEDFVKLFYEHFFCIYFKRFYSWESLHMLIKASKAYPSHFKTTFKVLVKDSEMGNRILVDYIETLDKDNCTNLLKIVSEVTFNADEFNRNLPVLYLLYKKCEVNENIFQFIHSNLELYSQYCAYNKNYGRLLLCFIEKMSGFNVRIRVIKKMIENHCTAFKSPCMALLEKILLDLLALQMNFHEGPRIVIPRPSENFEL